MQLLARTLLLIVTAAGAALLLVPSVRVMVFSPEDVASLERGVLFAPGSIVGMALGGLFVVGTLLNLVTWTSGPRKRRRVSDPIPTVDIKPGQKPTKKLARQLMEARRYKEAAEMFKELADVTGLVEALSKDNRVLEAAELLAAEGRVREAAELLEENGQAPAMAKAGELWRTLNNAERSHQLLRKAASLFAQRNEGDRSVELLMKNQDTDGARQFIPQAAEAYARRGDHVRAGEMFEAFGQDAQAAAAFEYDASTNRDERARRSSAVRAAKLFAKIGDMRGCGRSLEMAGLVDKAAEAYQRGEAWEDAARCLTAMGQTQKAAELLISKGLGNKAIQYFENSGDVKAAAHAAFAAGDLVRAAQLFEETNDLDGAFKSHVKAGNFKAAGDIAMQRNRPAEAAELFERAGDYKRAAEIHEGMNNRLKAGELFARGGDQGGAARMLLLDGRVKEAAALLQGNSKADTIDVVLDVTRKLSMMGDLKGAVQFLRASVDARPPGESIGMSLELSNLMEAVGDIPSALAYAQRVLGAKKDHAEAVMRVQQLFMRINSEHMRAAYEAAMQQQMAIQSQLANQKRIVEAAPKKDELPRYVPEAEIGRGAMGVVFRAKDTVLNRFVALKRLPEAVASDSEARARFLEEARAAAGLNHPSIVTVYDAGVERGLPFLAMELVEGTTLGNLLQERGPLPPSKALAYCAAIASALDTAHQAGIVHRDVKPGNILMGRDGRVKLTDFGIAAAVQRTGRDGITGTPYYMAPEQILQGQVDGRADIYALGCVLFALLTGQPPFTGADVLQRHLREAPPRLTALKPGTPVEIDQLLATCLAKDPRQRFQTAAQCAQAFLDVEARLRTTQAGAQ